MNINHCPAEYINLYIEQFAGNDVSLLDTSNRQKTCRQLDESFHENTASIFYTSGLFW